MFSECKIGPNVRSWDEAYHRGYIDERWAQVVPRNTVLHLQLLVGEPFPRKGYVQQIL